MLIDVKVKVARIVDNKIKKITTTFVLDREFFSQAEYTITQLLQNEQRQGTVDDYSIVSLKMSSIKEIADQYGGGEHNYIITLKDIFHADDGTEKYVRYKVLLWANNLIEANQRANQMSHEGYDMQIEGIKQVDYEYLSQEENEQGSADE